MVKTGELNIEAFKEKLEKFKGSILKFQDATTYKYKEMEVRIYLSELFRKALMPVSRRWKRKSLNFRVKCTNSSETRMLGLKKQSQIAR